MSQIAGSVPLNAYERMRILNQSVRPNTDFDCTDQEFFGNNGRLVRLRPPRKGERDGEVLSLRMIGMVPMVVAKRQSTTAAPRPIALIGFDRASYEAMMAELPRMGEDAILELLTGSPKTLFRSPPRWWPLP